MVLSKLVRIKFKSTSDIEFDTSFIFKDVAFRLFIVVVKFGELSLIKSLIFSDVSDRLLVRLPNSSILDFKDSLVFSSKRLFTFDSTISAFCMTASNCNCICGII